MLNNLFSKKLAVFFVFVILASCLVMANENASKTTKKMVRLVDFGSKQHQIRSIPTQIFFNELGEELFRHVGFISEDDILAKWAIVGRYFFRGYFIP
ncbi:MAG: hypothetical protein BWY02_00970 [bacterium ADurb.Bin157]|nr:MAG: hypothetical protein BWY02_00970 [bacterium ADurb.Bin157]